MAKMEHGDVCPRCRQGKVRRVQRETWMRRLPRSKHFRCGSCRTHFLTICGWRLRLPQKPEPEND